MTTLSTTLRSTGLSILLGFVPATASLGLGACDRQDEDETRGTGGSSSSSTTGGMTTTPFLTTSTSDSTTTANGTSTSDGSGSTSTTQGATSGDPYGTESETAGEDESGEVESESEGPPPGDAGCDARCLLEQECDPAGAEECYFVCIDRFDGLDEPCIEAMDALNGCVADLTCEELSLFNDPNATDRPCADQEVALEGC